MSTDAGLEGRYLDLVGRALINDLDPDMGARIVALVTELLECRWQEPSLKAIESQLAQFFRARPPVDRFQDSEWYVNIAGNPYTMISPQRLRNVQEAARTVLAEGIAGDFVETGVWRGGACIMMKAVLAAAGARRRIYVCDSFQGLPEITEGADAPLKLHENPLLAVSAGQVRENFDRFGLLDDDVIFVEGWFSETMPKLRHQVEAIALLRLDGDYYTSTREVIDELYDKVVPGGFVIVDDYGTYEQCRDAIHDFWAERGMKPEMTQVDAHCSYWRK